MRMVSIIVKTFLFPKLNHNAYQPFLKKRFTLLSNTFFILQLTKPLMLSDFILPVCLPCMQTNEVAHVFASGWGDTEGEFGISCFVFASHCV